MLEDGHHQPTVVLLERTRGILEQYPAWLVQQQARERQALLLVQRQILVPPLLAVQQRHEVIQTDPLERAADGSAVETIRLGGVAHRGVQTAERQVRSLRHEHHAVPWRQVDGAAAPWPQARHRPEQLALVGGGLADDQDALARGDLDPGVVERGATTAERDAEVLEPEMSRSMVDQPDATRFVAGRIGRGREPRAAP